MSRAAALRQLLAAARFATEGKAANTAAFSSSTAAAAASSSRRLTTHWRPSWAATASRRLPALPPRSSRAFSTAFPAAAFLSKTSSVLSKEQQRLWWRRVQEHLRARSDWAFGFNYRVAIINALYTTQCSSHWVRLASLFLLEAATRSDPLAWCYYLPVTEDEKAHMVAAEEADLLAAAAAGQLWYHALWRAACSMLRLLWLLSLFAPAAFSAPIAVGYGVRRAEWLRLLRKTLERAGPAFIKWGQWAATRADLFPPDMCKELEHLHTQAPSHPFPYTERAVQEAFGFDLDALFSSFETSPVASGSIGQIHRGVLSGAGARLTGMKDGSVVAVKVRHPGVSEAIERDFALMLAAARVVGSLPALQAFRLEESLEQFAAPLREQVDLGREGFYLHAFNYNFRRENKVSFPVPLYPLVSPAVLVETFEEGEHISSYVSRGAGAPFNSELAVVGARTMLHMLVVDNLVHSDLHPGNILVRLEPPGGALGAAALHGARSLARRFGSAFGWDPTEALAAADAAVLQAKIVLLDAGMATRLSTEDQINMVGLFDAFSRLEARAVANWTLRFAGEQQTCPDPDAFRQDLERHFKGLREADAFKKGDTSSGAEALAAVLETVRQHQVVLPGHICATVVTTLVLEGWSHQLDPAHSTLSEVKRIIALKKGETKLRKAAMWVQGAVEREILEHVPQFAIEERQQKVAAARAG